MKKSIVLTVALLAGAALSQFIVPASAADVNVTENPFNGVYFGVNGGFTLHLLCRRHDPLA